MVLLSQADIDEELKSLHGWSVVDKKLHKKFQFDDFKHAFDFMTRAAVEIEKMNHHPEWLNIYNRIIVDLTTHDAGGITKNDTSLARILNSLADT